MPALQIGATGADVKRLQKTLNAAGFNCGTPDGAFGLGTQAAVKAFQSARHLGIDGVAGAMTMTALGLVPPPGPDITASVTVDRVVQMLTGTSRPNVTTNLPNVLAALRAKTLVDLSMILVTLATIYVETGQFDPIPEGISQYNTSPGGQPFDLYNGRMGNGPKGALYKGRGFIQLTGHDNYRDIGTAIGADLVNNPDLALDPVIAARILAQFLKRAETTIRFALAGQDLTSAREAVNGGTYGLSEFAAAFHRGETIF
jgi:peptidoglycan L-alanyl-D-glutamate endopeptidase CwlK